jgi:ubiquinone/menaquinone biosynthesis C-methylase UbiE
MDEIERIKQVYRNRDLSGKAELYSLFNPSSLFLTQQRELAIIKIISAYGIRNLSEKKILDVGCGRGQLLRDFIKYGANPENCYGVDLLPDRIREAIRLSPAIDFRCENAETLSFKNEFFDIIMCFTVFSSILSENMKQTIVREMIRVMKKTGFIIWYDYWIKKPGNPDVRGIRKREIKRLFPNFNFKFHKITLAPPITRRLAKFSYFLCYFLDKINILNTHYLVIISKKD